VARAFVYRLHPAAISYRAALAFDQPIDASTCGPKLPLVLTSSPNAADKADLGSLQSDIVFDERLTA
jgi:hypothetical protein